MFRRPWNPGLLFTGRGARTRSYMGCLNLLIVSVIQKEGLHHEWVRFYADAIFVKVNKTVLVSVHMCK